MISLENILHRFSSIRIGSMFGGGPGSGRYPKGSGAKYLAKLHKSPGTTFAPKHLSSTKHVEMVNLLHQYRYGYSHTTKGGSDVYAPHNFSGDHKDLVSVHSFGWFEGKKSAPLGQGAGSVSLANHLSGKYEDTDLGNMLKKAALPMAPPDPNLPLNNYALERRVKAISDTLADKHGFPKWNIKLDPKLRSFSVGGKAYIEGASYDPTTGQISVSGPAFRDAVKKGSTSDLEGTLVHEMHHHIFNKVEGEYRKQVRTALWSKAASYDKDGDIVFANEHEAKVYPLVAKLSPYMAGTGAKILQEEDGVTPYSTSYWRAAGSYSSDSHAKTLAINETFAEVGKQLHLGNDDKVSSTWKEFHAALMSSYDTKEKKVPYALASSAVLKTTIKGKKVVIGTLANGYKVVNYPNGEQKILIPATKIDKLASAVGRAIRRAFSAGGPGSGEYIHQKRGITPKKKVPLVPRKKKAVFLQKHASDEAVTKRRVEWARQKAALKKKGLSTRGQPIVSDKAKRSLANKVIVSKKDQDRAEDVERMIAKKIGGTQSSNNQAFDVTHTDSKGQKHAIEVKALLMQKNDKITMKKDALDRKHAWLKANPGTKVHTIAVDLRGPKTKIYHKEGVGSFRTGTMNDLGGLSGLSKLFH